MIPDLELLRDHYDAEDFSAIERMQPRLNAVDDRDKRNALGMKWLRSIWPDELEFLAKTCWIVTKDARIALLKPNYAQLRFHSDVIQRCRDERRPIRGIILKARQLGFSTFIQAWQYCQLIQNNNRSAMTISYDDDSTEELFGKAKLMHDRFWFSHKTVRSRSKTLQFDDPLNSVFYAVTAGNENVGRGRTLQHLHCSELPFWPDAYTSTTAVQQSLPDQPWTSNFYESTAQGAQGFFYEEWNKAEDERSAFVPFFAPWTWDPTYAMEFPSEDHKRKFLRELKQRDREYLTKHNLTPEQMQWRAWTIANKLNGSEPKFRQEYPITPEEAFLSTGNPVFNPERVMELAANCNEPFRRCEILLEHETHPASIPGGQAADLG